MPKYNPPVTEKTVRGVVVELAYTQPIKGKLCCVYCVAASSPSLCQELGTECMRPGYYWITKNIGDSNGS